MKDKARVCFLTPFFYPVIGGVETHILEIGKELIKKGHEVYVVTSDSDRMSRLHRKNETYQGIKIIRCRTLLRVSFGEIIFPAAIREIIRINPDVVHIHGFRHWYNLIPLLTAKPCFLTPHWPDYRGQRPRAIQAIADTLDWTIGKALMNTNKRICIVTEDEKKWIKSFRVKDEKIILTPNALPKNYFMAKKKSNFRKKHNIGKDVVVLCVSRIHKSKGLDQVIRVAQMLPECKFVILGKDGGEQSNLEGLAKELEINNVIFGGEVSEKEKIEAYNGADIFCQPSHFEAFGISILEAMSQGLPCVVTKKGGMPWVVQDSGLTFEENNIDDLYEKIKSIAKNGSLRKKMGSAAARRARQFTWKKTAGVLDKEYARIMHQKE